MNKRWLILGFAALATVAQAGTVVHMQRRTLPDGKFQPHSVIYAQGGQFRMDSLDANGQVLAFVLIRDGNIWQVDVTKRTFYHFDQAALAERQSALQERMQAVLQRLPAAQRAAMEARVQAMMQHAQQSTVSLTDTGRSDHAGTWSCEIWQLQRNGKTVSDACMASADALTGGRELVEAAHRAAATAAEVLSSLPVARASAQHMALYAKSDGFPVRTRELSDGQPDDEEIVSSIETQRLPNDKFAIPKGYTEVRMSRAEDDDD